MARAYECSECQHRQIVGVIDNGLSGFADPRAVCERCGATGKFHFAPGYAESIRRPIRNAVHIDASGEHEARQETK